MYQIKVCKTLYIVIFYHNFGRECVNKKMLDIHFLGKSYQKQMFPNNMNLFKVQQKL